VAKKKTIKKPQKPDTGLNARQLRFCEEYLICFNGTQAAIKAGYSEKTAGVIASENLKKPNIRAFIDNQLAAQSLGKAETVKLMSDMAQGCLNEYFVVVEQVETPQVQKSLKQLIKELNHRIEDQHKLIERAKISNADVLQQFYDHEAQWLLQIIQYQIELERNPNAYRIVPGEPRMVQTAVLDLPKLVKDKERGKIKSITPNEHGLKIELYGADGMLRDMARYHGLFEKDNQQQPPINLNVGNLSQTDLKMLLALKQKAAK
jgi:phage terminase small subunit